MYFFVSNLEKNFVEKEESEHFWSCRVQTDKTYKICDQKGTVATIKISKMDKKSTRIEFKILEKNHIPFEDWLKINQKNVKVLFQAQIDKNYLEKWVEVLPFGLWSKVFIFASEFSPKQNINLERLNRILTRSMEQSENIYKPNLEIISKKKLFEIIQKEVEKSQFENKNSSKFLSQFIILQAQNMTESENLELQKQSLGFNSKVKKDNSANNLSDNSSNISQISNFVVGCEGGFSESEEQAFTIFGCQFKTVGEIIYPSWLATFLVQ